MMRRSLFGHTVVLLAILNKPSIWKASNDRHLMRAFLTLLESERNICIQFWTPASKSRKWLHFADHEPSSMYTFSPVFRKCIQINRIYVTNKRNRLGKSLAFTRPEKRMSARTVQTNSQVISELYSANVRMSPPRRDHISKVCEKDRNQPVG